MGTRSEKRAKGKSAGTHQIWQDQVKANVRIKNTYHKHVQGSVSTTEKYCIEIQSNRPISNYVVKQRKDAVNFKRCSVDFCYPYGTQSQTRLSKLKSDGIIGGWFLTAGGCNLVITPPNQKGSASTQTASSKTNGPKPKHGVLLKVPDLDLFIEAQSFDDFRKFQQRGIFVSRDGKIAKL